MILGREEGGERERRNIDVREKNQLVVSRMSPDPGIEPTTFSVWGNDPTN